MQLQRELPCKSSGTLGHLDAQLIRSHLKRGRTPNDISSTEDDPEDDENFVLLQTRHIEHFFLSLTDDVWFMSAKKNLFTADQLPPNTSPAENVLRIKKASIKYVKF